MKRSKRILKLGAFIVLIIIIEIIVLMKIFGMPFSKEEYAAEFKKYKIELQQKTPDELLYEYNNHATVAGQRYIVKELVNRLNTIEKSN